MEIRRNPVNSKGENNASSMGYELLRRSMVLVQWLLMVVHVKPVQQLLTN